MFTKLCNGNTTPIKHLGVSCCESIFDNKPGTNSLRARMGKEESVILVGQGIVEVALAVENNR